MLVSNLLRSRMVWSAWFTWSLAWSLASCREAPAPEPTGARAPAPAETPAAVAPPREESAARLRPQIPDTELVDQNGRRVRFYTDVVKGKLVLMNAIFTRCQATCPVQAGVFSKVQPLLGARLGRDVRLVSVSVDPTYDTPERMKEFGERHGALPGWLLLTGDKASVDTVLKAMDLYAAQPSEHTPLAAVGNEPTGVWMKALNLSAPVELVKKLDYVASLSPSALLGGRQ